MSGLMYGNDAPFRARGRTLAICAGHGFVKRAAHVVRLDGLRAAPGRGDGGLVEQVFQRSPGKAARVPCQRLKIDGARKRFVTAVEAENAQTLFPPRQPDFYLPVEAPGAQQRGIERIEAIGGGEDDDAVRGPEAGHFAEERVECLVAFVGRLLVALLGHGVDLIDEDDALAGLARVFEQLTHAARRPRPRTSEQNPSRKGRRRARPPRLPAPAPAASCPCRAGRRAARRAACAPRSGHISAGL